MSKSVIGSLNFQNGHPIKRKVVDVSGRLGSLYDASTDNLIDRHSVQRFERTLPNKLSICRVFSGDVSTEPISLLTNIDFDDAVQRSIHLYLVVPSGTARLIEYGQPINQNTRFLYYSYRSRKEKLAVKAGEADKVVAPPAGPTAATHMITKILWGIEILCVIQIPKNQSINAIDLLLERICNQLKHNEFPVQLTNDDRRLINQLTNITVYGSETCVNDPHTSLLTILDRIQDWQSNENFHQPITYTIQPLRWLYNNIRFQEPCGEREQANPHLNRIDSMFRRIENQLKILDAIFVDLPANFSSPILNEHLKKAQQQYRALPDIQENLQERLRKTIPDVRQHHIKPIELDNIIEDQRYECLRRADIEKFQATAERLLSKAILIENLNRNRIEYINVFDLRSSATTPLTNDAIDTMLKRSQSNEKHSVLLWYSSDRLKLEQADKWEQIYQQVISERQQTAQTIKLIYADFTYCQQRLEGFTLVQLPLASASETRLDPIVGITPRPLQTSSVPSLLKLRHISSSPPPPIQTRRSLTPPLPTTSSSISHPASLPASLLPQKTEINVLLLGETGVGKSTFINAFVNYLKFETLQKAERGEPVVLIPASFLITTGDQFDEFIVKFGNPDSNENHEHQGQSVTQQCKSYVFDLNDRTYLRLIDTPGIGDTRGINHDVKNIDHILTYINNFTHLNAICLLLKPNASRLNVFFRSCLNQLLTFVTPIAYNNILFCFTNGRATFYAPGDTDPLLRKMLNDENLTIPFQKSNTFCFDSQSFRYLAQRKLNVDFDDYHKKRCTDSWNKSVTESLRLLNFIQTREPYYLDEWLSPRKAALDISMLARPLIETLRLIIYNWKLSEAKLIANQIVLNSTQIDIDMCTHCAQINLIEVGPFWITQYQRVLSKSNTSQHHLCPSNGKHFLVETIIQHELVAEPAGLKNERWQSSFHNFLFKCDRLVHFLRQQDQSVEDDPFQPILERFLQEEQQISQIRNINSHMNKKVREVLQAVKEKRQQNSQQLLEANERLSLNQVYQMINELIIIPTVQKQTDSIKKSRQIKMKIHECRIPTHIIQNRAFTGCN